MRKLFLILINLFLLINCKTSFGQKAQFYKDSTVVNIDSIVLRGSEYTLIHYHLVSPLLQRKIILDTKDSIFDNRYNDFSRLIFNTWGVSFDVPTVPLTHIIFLESPGLILGLSKIAASHYNIVIYNKEGKLIHKARLGQLELKFNVNEIRELIVKYSELKTCLSEMTIVKNDDFYYLPISSCLLNVIGRDSIVKLNKFTSSRYFPHMTSTTAPFSFRYKRYHDYFSDSDPLNELILVGSIPYLLVLNSEKGTKVNVPLKANCDILKEVFHK